MSTVTIIDYGLSNILSLQRALVHCGAKVQVANAPSDVACAKRIILPGVGSFGCGINTLQNSGLITPLREFAAQNKPLLGICLGMQFLHQSSDEGGFHPGLGIIPGSITHLPLKNKAGFQNKVPNVRWCSLHALAGKQFEDPLLCGISPGMSTYFVHSYHAPVKNDGTTIAAAYFAGHPFSAIVRKGQIYGTQFHPEKSGDVGLRILRNFLLLPTH
ncbi:MAG: imidazole glycerol phosphate synthase subunit HisH [Desulfovibrio sp.]|jgi:glutamine amidotransferase